MASRLSQQEENYVRMSLLLTGISPRAVRALFDREFAPSCLDSSLKKEYNKLKDLQKKRIINQSQWNLLFRRLPDVPDSKTFDVTLMIILLRHLTDLTPPHGGYDRLPSDDETTPTSDLARIKYYRNFLAHLDEGKIEDMEFITAWNIVTDAISRLGGQPMKQECDNLKVKLLDQSNQEIILDIKRSNDEIIELKKSVESLKKANEDTVPWNIRAQINEILVEWQDTDKMFITTRAAKHVLKCIKENSCVTITASSGVGKTATLRHVALQMATEGYDVLLVTDPGDIVRFYNPDKKMLFVIDDLYGNYCFNQTDIKVWDPFMERINKILSNKLSKIIVACRLQVYQDDKFESSSVFKSCVCNLLSENLCLSAAEKGSIAEFYLKTKASEIVDYYDLYDCFPLLCKLYHENPSINITDFFRNPFIVYEAEIDKLQKKGFYSKYCALALCVIFNNSLNEEILTEDVNEETRAIIENTCEACKLDRGTSRLTLHDDLNSLIHTFLKKERNRFKTIHDKIFDFLVYYFGKKTIRCLIKNAHSGLIGERFLLERQNNMDKFVTIVPTQYHQMYTQRMIEDWSKGKVNDVFCNINMKIPQFRTKFLCCLNELDTINQRQLAHTFDVDKNDTALIELCFIGDIPMIHWCLSLDVDVNQCRNNETTPLIVAVNEGLTEIVRILLDKGADYNKCGSDGWSSVMIACRVGHTYIVRMFLDKGADYDKCNNNGWSPVMSACRYGHTEIVRMLIDKGADYNKCDNDGWSSIMSACCKGHTEIVRMLLDKGADYNKCDNNGVSPLIRAIMYEHNEIVRMLLDKGAAFDECSNNGWSPVMSACRVGHTEIVRMLLDKGADFDKCNNNGWSPVMSACSEGHTEIVKMLLDKGADYNECNKKSWSPVMIACRYGHTEIVRMLVDKGANFDKCNNNGWSPVMSACRVGHTEIVRMLLDKGADFDKCNNNGWLPVMISCGVGHTEIVRKLLDKGADYNKCDNDGWSSIMSACCKGHTEIVRMLLDKGADFDKCNNNGWSPVMSACRVGHTEIVRMLLDKGADFDKCNNNGWSPVMSACRYGHTEIVRMLLDKGADYNKCDNDGSSPVMRACRYGHTKIVRMLLDKGAD
ncbi:Putative ankyrin repeat protein L93 [Mytilus coruscus]|uniref:Ankyrin repeat protein L93 n=1 Tax=Mytilus coruscus TaxID=42192 RepID=A0A6J8CS00_MYTCO|nr:Putative ankyrin repeat protein L93 [Mytilus coruscus]